MGVTAVERFCLIVACGGILLVLPRGDAAANILAFPLAVALALSPIIWLEVTCVAVLAEIVLYEEFLKLGTGRATLAGICANLVSGVVGAVPVVVIGTRVETYLGTLPIGFGLGLLFGMIAAVALIPLINAVLEYPVLRLFGAPRGLRSFKVVYLTNLGTTIPFLAIFAFSVL